ncbi:MAG TPA: phosphoenolpyruvate--protein phosphotransferase, partial [Bacillales bacterium]|nr:phosphoenolpyruvate--protein phosphotransferase [Bacillales bacterium]
MSIHLKGIAASGGIAIAPAFILKNPVFDVPSGRTNDIETEKNKLKRALGHSRKELEAIKEHAVNQLGEDTAEIFSAHLLVLQDPDMIVAVTRKIDNERLTAESAFHEVAASFVETFESMENAYMRERAADLRDVAKRVLSHLLGIEFTSPALITEEAIVIADDLTPSDTAQLNRRFVKGFATDIGGRTSHSAIMARSLEIPAVVGAGELTKSVENGDYVIIDGTEGTIIVDPTDEELSRYRSKQKDIEVERKRLKQLVSEKTLTLDGKHVELAANIGSTDDLAAVINNGAEGIGLFRTEFLYMGREQLPSEDEQFAAYKSVLEKMRGKPVVIRTLDIGGDKKLPYLQLPKELNPFLGVRAIRLCFEEQKIFRTQLRALLRAGAFGNLHV